MIERMYTKDELIYAMQRYNQDYLSNPEKYAGITKGAECATDQVEGLLSFVQPGVKDNPYPSVGYIVGLFQSKLIIDPDDYAGMRDAANAILDLDCFDDKEHAIDNWPKHLNRTFLAQGMLATERDRYLMAAALMIMASEAPSIKEYSARGEFLKALKIAQDDLFAPVKKRVFEIVEMPWYKAYPAGRTSLAEMAVAVADLQAEGISGAYWPVLCFPKETPVSLLRNGYVNFRKHVESSTEKERRITAAALLILSA